MKTNIKNGLVTIVDNGKLTTSELLKAIGCKYWSYWSDSELDKQFPPNKTSRQFKWIQEADPENKNKSADDCEKEGLQSITLRERIIFEKLWFDKTKTHLDIDSVTICAGSRHRDGSVPGVDWGRCDDGLGVSRYHPRFAHGSVRARACVQLDSAVELKHEENKDKQGFNITCERCGLSTRIK